MKNKGFTLIELLVVIAIIGILSGFLVLSIKPKERTDEAKDAMIKNAVDGFRVAMIDYFSNNNNSFEGADNDSKIKQIIEEENFILETSANKWAVKGQLKNGKWFCRDSEGYVSEKDSQDITDYMCD